jgi:hypothetical protein
MLDFNFDFQNSLQAFLDSVFGFVNGLLNAVFGWLALFFDGLAIV